MTGLSNTIRKFSTSVYHVELVESKVSYTVYHIGLVHQMWEDKFPVLLVALCWKDAF